MKILQQISLLIVAFAALATTAFGGEGWLTDYDQALAVAKKEKKPILMYFGSSDSCPPCIIMERDTFSKEEFQAYAKKNLVLLHIDFQMRKPFNMVEATRNDALQKRFQVEGYPTFLLLNPTGYEEERLVGYQRGGPAGLIKALSKKVSLPPL